MSRLRDFGIGCALLLWGCSDDKTQFGTNNTPRTSIKKSSAGAEASGRTLSNTSTQNGFGAENVSTANASAEPETVATENFSAQQSAGKIDIVWLVDQSGSMREETEHVKNNLRSFIGRIDQKIDARHALVASTVASTNNKFPLNLISMGIISAKVKQVDQFVNSNNALQIAAAAFTQPTAPLDSAIVGSALGTKTKSSLVNFFRTGVRPVVVVVTDDDATGVDDKNFLNLLSDNTKSLGIKPIIYSFAGLSVISNISSGCSIAAIGAAYINLANTTGGRVFDICQTDWTENFNKLTEGLVAAAQNTFTLKNRAKRILDVYINGKPVSLSKVFSSANNITISPDVLNPNGETNILINYAY